MRRAAKGGGLRVLVCPDKFKGSMTAYEAARAMALGVRRARPGAVVRTVPLADGGEGTAEVLRRALGGVTRRAVVVGPLGTPVRARWTWEPSTRTAVVELAEASGLALVAPRRRNPMRTTSFGTGQLMRAALAARPKRLWVAVGGSATTDGGAGLLGALGARFFDDNGREMPGPMRGRDVGRIARVDLSDVAVAFKNVDVAVLCDVDNPLTGARGSAKVFAPQKGARPTDVAALARGLERWARVLARAGGQNVLGVSRMGAAGGAAAGLAVGVGARLLSGAEAVTAAVNLDAAVRWADIVLTGEGAVDRTSSEGKIVGRVVALCARRGVPVHVLTGRMGAGWRRVLRAGARSVREMAPGADVAASIKHAERYLIEAAGQVF